MIAERIKIVPFQIERIMECEIVKKVNEHGRAYIKGYISSEEEKKYLDLASSEPTVQIEAVSEEGECAVIFSGLMKDCRIRNSNQVLTMELSLVTHTWLMDLRLSIRSFQTPGMPYQQLFDTIAGSYSGGGCMMSEGGARVTEDLIVQYQETDWEFLKRLASHLNTVVVPSYRTDGVKCYTGLPQWSGLTKVSPVSYTACRLVSDYLYKQQNQVQGLIEEDELCYEIQDLHVFDLGEQVEFQGRTYYVTECRSYLDGHQLWNTYLIKTKSGIRVPQTYNEKMVGASLDGTISGVAGAKVKVRLTPDAGGGSGKWFPFSTVYSSPDGSGWYCMPEIGDEIRLYFPTVKEKHAYVISAVHQPVPGRAGTDRGDKAEEEKETEEAEIPVIKLPDGREIECRSNPEDHLIKTKSDKIVLLNEKLILLSNNKGLSILIDDDEGITISSALKVDIRSDSSVEIAGAGGIEVTGTGAVTLKQGSGMIRIADSKVVFSGAETRIQ